MKNTKEKIQKAASELFADKGYKQTTIRDICQKAAVNVAAVNYHFKGKQDLIESIVEYIFKKRAKRHQSFIKDRNIENEEQWKKAIYDFIFMFISDPECDSKIDMHLSKLFFRELSNPSDFFQKMHSKYLTPVDAQLKKYLSMGLPKGTPDEQVSLWVLTIISQCGFFRHKHGLVKNITQIDFRKPENIKMMADHIAGTIFASLHYQGS